MLLVTASAELAIRLSIDRRDGAAICEELVSFIDFGRDIAPNVPH